LKKLFWDVSPLDKLAREIFLLSEELMMEHAALAIKNEICSRFEARASVLIAVGSGNNGADGYALARLLDSYNVEVLEVLEAKSELCKLQKSRCKKSGIKFVSSFGQQYDVVVDAIFGSGLQNDLSDDVLGTIGRLNELNGFKIACDFPSGLNKSGSLQKEVFKADSTVCMGAGKIGLFSDMAKDFVGVVSFAALGLSDEHYLGDASPEGLLLEVTDLKLPIRVQKCSHKGTYGHIAVFVGDKEGAGILCGMSSLGFGAGLVTLISTQKINTPVDLMQNENLPENTNVICIGSGLGDVLSEEEIICISKTKASFVVDADMFYKQSILEFLDKPCVLTPHPKEFASLLQICDIGCYSVEDIQSARFELAKQFSSKYQSIVLVLKGANPIIAHKSELFVCNLGSVSLAKGGSGDVLSGVIGALLAQKFSPLESAKNGVLAHALASQKIKNNYALTPSELIEALRSL
jgi:hydroxyethylthiazole kinase-like uncharacterized protein yjeF